MVTLFRIVMIRDQSLKEKHIDGVGSETLYHMLDKKMANLQIDPFFYFKQAQLYDKRLNFLLKNTSYKSVEDLGFLATQKFDEVLAAADISNPLYDTDLRIGREAADKFSAPYRMAMEVIMMNSNCENKEQEKDSKDQEIQEGELNVLCNCIKMEESAICDCIIDNDKQDVLCNCLKCKKGYAEIQKIMRSNPEAALLAEDVFQSYAFLHPTRTRTLRETSMLRVLELGLEPTGLPRTVQKALSSGPRGMDLGILWNKWTRRFRALLKHLDVNANLIVARSMDKNEFFWKGREEFIINIYEERKADRVTVCRWFVSRSTDPEELVDTLLHGGVIKEASRSFLVEVLRKNFSKRIVEMGKHLETSPNAVFLCKLTYTSRRFNLFV